PTSTLFPYTTLFRSRPDEVVFTDHREHVLKVVVLQISLVLHVRPEHLQPVAVDEDADLAHVGEIDHGGEGRGGGDTLVLPRRERSEEHTSELQSREN